MTGFTQITGSIRRILLTSALRKNILAALAFSFFLCFSATAENASRSASATAPFTTHPKPSFWQSPILTGKWGGARKKLEDRGIFFPVSYAVDVLGNPLGGVFPGVVYTGNLTIGANLDFQKLLGWEGFSFGTQWVWISGNDLSEKQIQNLFSVDGMAAFQTFRLTSLWLQQNFFTDKISLRAGVLALDTEFGSTAVGALFINSIFGWPPFLNNNIPNGGPGTPIGAPGIRLAIHPTDWFTYQAAVTQGDIYPQNVNRHGFRWRLNTALFVQEAIFHLNPTGRYWGHYRIGSWIYAGDTPSPFDEGVHFHSNHGFYIMADQMLLPTSTDNKNQGLSTFCRIAYAPPRSNNFPFYVDGGLTYTGPLSCRPKDSVGIAVAYGQLSKGAVYAATHGLGSMRRSGELVLEATYSFQVNSWMALQPDFQYIVQPGGVGRIPNAFVLGLRASINF